MIYRGLYTYNFFHLLYVILLFINHHMLLVSHFFISKYTISRIYTIRVINKLVFIRHAALYV